MNITVLQIHKRDSYQYKFIQDQYTLNKANSTFAIADGTTQSFNSETWAKLLTDSFVEKPEFDANQLIEDFEKISIDFENINFKYSSNPAKASLELAKKNKGGTSTFLGLQFIRQNKIKMISCGDSNLFISDGKAIKVAYPFSDIDTLDANNYFLNTEALKIKKIEADYFQIIEIDLEGNEKIVLATDALSRLILKKNTVIINELFEISNFEELHDFCLKYWDSKELQEDDITAVIIKPFAKEELKEIVPPVNFEFPKIEIPEFIPATTIDKTQLNFTLMQMEEIKNQFNGVANDFHYVKQGLRTNRLLMLLIIFLLSCNLIFLYVYRPKNNESIQRVKTEKVENMKKESNSVSKKQLKKEQENNTDAVKITK
tara:strand:- start:3838 stop:4956 length:1119 start_codon:yes stop_codon:yes gene_type:complete